ncbi:hypothetical protein CC77DRAFT_718216 [Alternaria alternata]|jgi:hypothetical protein|uniref:Uncharacterized protein n=1 Tax=Alternaria alternata TaxID=5599 RepID=A0A177DWP4_ALTAL|nr:hypothetical protein CC77DRAFT_718216 [Alternaria alternata]OAG23422.1 hypothetical protein CC77DRAFT_718216 [Alternaria alternata]
MILPSLNNSNGCDTTFDAFSMQTSSVGTAVAIASVSRGCQPGACACSGVANNRRVWRSQLSSSSTRKRGAAIQTIAMSSRQTDQLLRRSWKVKAGQNYPTLTRLRLCSSLMHSAMRQTPCSLATGPVSHVCPSLPSLRHPIAAQAPIHGGCGSAQTPVSSIKCLGLRPDW